MKRQKDSRLSVQVLNKVGTEYTVRDLHLNLSYYLVYVNNYNIIVPKNYFEADKKHLNKNNLTFDCTVSLSNSIQINLSVRYFSSLLNLELNRSEHNHLMSLKTYRKLNYLLSSILLSRVLFAFMFKLSSQFFCPRRTCNLNILILIAVLTNDISDVSVQLFFYSLLYA